ncbi:PAS domain S-box protein [Pseudomonas oryzihabitans]|uniref:PAS domain S-box protein n=1 Tax=Pseudomonas oryzihabitans TaxID=47885 RepID=UPI00111CF223|nr:PAS domain S-box protein [Pseudomonas psychrotolerans]QDD92075.1 hybrid sensor histidine kinase/response regulator [Pseudomonas psychrotolerans]
MFKRLLSSSRVRWSLGVFLCGVLLTSLAMRQLAARNDQQLHSALDSAADDVRDQVLDRLRTYEYSLIGMRDLVVVAGGNLSRQLLGNYGRVHDLGQEFRGARGVGFIRRVPQAEEARFLREASADGWPNFTIRAFAPHDGDRYVVQYLEPISRNLKAIGMDAASDPIRREAAVLSMQHADIHLTGPLQLQASTPPEAGFLMMLPIYEEGLPPADPRAREAATLGWSYVPLSIEEMFGSLRLNIPGLIIRLSDVTVPDAPRLFYRHGEDEEGARELSERRLVQGVYGRQWQLAFTATPTFVAAQNLVSVPLVHLFGKLFSLLAAGLTFAVLTTRQRRRQYQQDQANLTAVVESSSDGIISKDLNGVVLSWNHAAEQLFGYPASEAVGQRLLDLVVPAELEHEEWRVLERIGKGEPVPHFETRRQHRDGRYIDVLVSVSPMRGRDGRVVGASKTVRDISVQKAAQAEILALNARLEGQVAQRTAELSQTNRLLGDVLRAASEVGIIATDRDGRITLFNEGAERLLGYRADEVVGTWHASDFHLPEELEAQGQSLSAQYGAPISGFRVLVERSERVGAEAREWTYIRRDGEHRDVSLVVTTMRDGAGQVSGYLGIASDVTERKAAELELAASLALTRAILDTAVNPIVTVDSAGLVRSFNPAGERIFGYHAEQVIGQPIHRLIPGYLAGYEALFSCPLELPDSDSGQQGQEMEGRRQDGSVFPITLSLGVMWTDGERLAVAIIADITEQSRQRQVLLRTRDQLAMAADVAELGIWCWQPDTGQVQCNERMFELYEWTDVQREQGLTYNDWRCRVHPDDLPDAEERLGAAMAGRATFDPVFRIRRQDGSLRHILAGAHTERDPRGRVLRVVGINRDITEQLELEHRLREERTRADLASQAKSSFLANMSHEIRTPMNAVLGMLQLLQRTALDNRQGDYLTKAQQAARSLLGLLNDVLDYSKIEAGKLQLDVHPFSLEQVLRNLGVVLSGNSGEKNVEINYQLEAGLPTALVGDSLRLQQILINLAGNALKFTEAGQVLVSVRQLSQADGPLRLEFSVQDTGIGISPDQQAQLFQGFTQAEASISRRFGGTGLGLAICKRLVELMDGQLQVESELGVGSRFWFDVTLAVDSQGEAQLAPVRRRVLLADDNTLVGEVLVETLAALGWQVDLVTSGAAALEQVAQAQRQGQPYEAVLMDWRMPDGDGLAAARQLHESQSAERPRVIMLTGFGRDFLNEAQQSGEAPFDDYLTKPVTPAQIVEAVERALGAEIPAGVHAAAMVDESHRLAGLRLLVVEDNALNRQVAAELLLAQGAQVELAEGGLEGVERVLSGTPLDVVIMDMQMPDIDGLEATRRIRADGRFSTLPILAMTANASHTDRDACLAAGMDDHIGKPIDLELLVSRLQRLTGREVAPMVSAASVTDERRIEPLGVILRRFGGDARLFGSLLERFAEDSQDLLARLEQAWSAVDTEGAVAVLHSLKGSAGTMGAQCLAAHAADGERAGKAGAGIPADVAAELATLRLLLDEALAELRSALAERLPPPPAQIAATLIVDWSARLDELALLLGQGNLEALDRLAELPSQCRAEAQVRYDLFRAQVETLDFAAALATLPDLKEAL